MTDQLMTPDTRIHRENRGPGQGWWWYVVRGSEDDFEYLKGVVNGQAVWTKLRWCAQTWNPSYKRGAQKCLARLAAYNTGKDEG